MNINSENPIQNLPQRRPSAYQAGDGIDRQKT